MHTILPVMDICQIIKIMSQPGKSINDLTNEIGFTAENILQTALLKYIVCINPELSVIYDILYSIPDNLENQQQRTCDFADAVKERDIVCRITGRFAERCQVAHIYEYKDCKDSGDRYNINNGILLDAGLHKLWDMNEIVFEPLNETTALFKINPYSLAKPHDIPELCEPVQITNIPPTMMKFIKMRYHLSQN